MTSRKMALTTNGVVSPLSRMSPHYLGRCTPTENWNSLAEVHESQETTSITRLETPGLVTLGIFSTLPFQLDHRDQSLLFHCKQPFQNFSEASPRGWIVCCPGLLGVVFL